MSKTKQTYMRAVIGPRNDGARNDNGKRVLTGCYKLVDKKTERTVVDCRLYMDKSASASAVHCSLWVTTKTEFADGYNTTSGRGVAGGYGYHKSSAAVDSAIRNAGIELYGSHYGHPVNGDSPAKTRALLKQHASIAGCGTGSLECALFAIAYAAGWNDCIMVRW